MAKKSRRTYRKRTVRRRKRVFRKKRSGNPLFRKVRGAYYKTSFTQVFPMLTSDATPVWAGITVNLFAGKLEGSDPVRYLDFESVNPKGQQGHFLDLFDQYRISGVRLKVIIPPATGNYYTFLHATTGQADYVPVAPSRLTWAYDPNDQIGIEATQDQLAAKSGYQATCAPTGGVVTRYFSTSKMMKDVGLGTGYTRELSYNGQIQDGTGPSVHVRLITSIQGLDEKLPDNFRLGQLEVTYYVTYKGKKAPDTEVAAIVPPPLVPMIIP